MPTLLLARHGQASFGGPDYDVLSPLGIRQAEALAGALAGRAVRVDRVVSGSLARQRDTAAPVAAAMGCPVEVDPRWDEYATDAILARYSGSGVRASRPPGSDPPQVSSREFQDILEGALRAWVAGRDGGSGIETWTSFAGRVRAALADVAGGLRSGDTALVSTSGGVLGAACVALLGVPDEAFVTFNRVTVNAGLTKVVHGRGGTTLVTFNEHSHLEPALVTYR
jgi:broad specificity phosphatase PhoE